MTREKVLFIANSLDNAYKFQQVLAELDVDIAAGSTAQIKRFLVPGANWDLVIFEALGSARASLAEVGSLAESIGFSLLVIADESNARRLGLPVGKTRDFVMSDAGRAECRARALRLLNSRESHEQAETINVDGMTINLETYQVSVAGEPVDFTYLEYTLLTFLVQHPDRAYSRDDLLHNVWGFNYYGGSRTVDVHVRRVRAKLGPNLAQHIETVRAVGYLWNSR